LSTTRPKIRRGGASYVILRTSKVRYRTGRCGY
jgi:hypothetical protein